MHRVTFVSRVLAPLTGEPETLGDTMRQLDIDSNYELVRTLEPFVRDKSGDAFVAAVKTAVAEHLPELRPHEDDIVKFMVGYYGAADADGVTNADDAVLLASTPPFVDAGEDQTVALHAPAAVSGTVLDEVSDAGALSLTWSVLNGPGDAAFTDPQAATTGVTFSAPGAYLLQLQAGGRGRPSAFDEVVVTVTDTPAGPPPDTSPGAETGSVPTEASAPAT